MKVFAYGRVSTNRQELSPEVQRKTCEAWINYTARTGRFNTAIEVGGWYFDNAVSAGKYRFFERPAAECLMQEIRPGDVLVVSHFDRIFRSTLDCCIVMEHMQANGIGMVIIDADFDTTTPIGRACMKIVSAIKELEREEIVRRIKDANKEIISRGGYVGTPSIGWKAHRKDKRKCVPDNIARRKAERMWNLKKSGMSYDEIRDKVRPEGIRMSTATQVKRWCDAHENGYPTQHSRMIAKLKDEKESHAQQQPAPEAPVVLGHLSLEPPESSAQTL